LEQARAAQSKLASMLAGIGELGGIGITLVDGGYGLRVNLTAEVAADAIPLDVDGIPVVVELVGEIRPL
jgi:hypothetical protein